MIATKEITKITLTNTEEKDLIETIFEMARTVRPNHYDDDYEVLKAVGNIVKDLKDYEEAKSIDY